MPSGGSHPRYARDLRALVEADLAAGVRQRDIARSHRVSESFVYQMRLHYEAFGTTQASPSLCALQGRRRKVHKEAEEGIIDFLEEYPTARRDEVVDFLADEYDISCGVHTAGRVLQRLKMTYKTARLIHTEQDDELRATYLAEIARSYTVDQIVAIDESVANERTRDRKYGWSPKGMPCRVKLPGRRSKRWSILPALGIGGFLHYEIYHGSYNGDRLNDFVERLLPKMNAFPGPRSVLLLDNASSHHNHGLRALCEAVGVRLLYLPPYSPDLNPIELSFNELKAWMRRERELSYEYDTWYPGFMALGLEYTCGEETARGYFRTAGWSVPDDMKDVDYSELEKRAC